MIAVFRALTIMGLLVSVSSTAPAALDAQARGNRASTSVSVGDVSFGVEITHAIERYYDTNPAVGVEGLPPGIRKNLARGKPLPPGIAKKTAPTDLVSGLTIPQGYEVVEVGWDVLLVDATTSLIHDVLTDVLR